MKASENFKLMGLDIGTTSLKAAVFDGTGKRLAVRAVDYTLDTDAETGFIEFDANEYIVMCRRVIDELQEECGRIDALSVDTQGETLILTDEGGKPLCPAVVWLDNRAVKEADAIKAKFGGKRVYESPSLDEIRDYCAEQVETLWDEVKRFDNPQTYYVDLSQKLWDVKYGLLQENGKRRM